MAEVCAIPKDFFTKLYEPTCYELEKPITPSGHRISKALATELNARREDASIADD